jgi:hypothetical protein
MEYHLIIVFNPPMLPRKDADLTNKNLRSGPKKSSRVLFFTLPDRKIQPWGAVLEVLI